MFKTNSHITSALAEVCLKVVLGRPQSRASNTKSQETGKNLIRRFQDISIEIVLSNHVVEKDTKKSNIVDVDAVKCQLRSFNLKTNTWYLNLQHF